MLLNLKLINIFYKNFAELKFIYIDLFLSLNNKSFFNSFVTSVLPVQEYANCCYIFPYIKVTIIFFSVIIVSSWFFSKHYFLKMLKSKSRARNKFILKITGINNEWHYEYQIDRDYLKNCPELYDYFQVFSTYNFYICKNDKKSFIYELKDFLKSTHKPSKWLNLSDPLSGNNNSIFTKFKECLVVSSKAGSTVILPVNTDVKIFITSKDYFYKWSIPDLNISLNAVPGAVNEALINLDSTGYHYVKTKILFEEKTVFMPLKLEVVEKEIFEARVSIALINQDLCSAYFSIILGTTFTIIAASSATKIISKNFEEVNEVLPFSILITVLASVFEVLLTAAEADNDLLEAIRNKKPKS